ncbi:large ribosomal subunit protein uL18m [Diabrotica undecimpunctata]|uniref:large ribosomal subunit protein uL18m n=1 Tax=Diabrotica undecimpunctata TaxID=50387 RepID=UPI003B63371F
MFKSFQNAYRSFNIQQLRYSTILPKNEISPIITNRNPRNLERLRIGYKPDGYHLDAPGKRYWHKLLINVSGKYIRASIQHFQNGEIISASTSEWSIKKQLYRTIDTCAYTNLGRVLAQRCLQAGLIEISCFIKPSRPDDKIALFLKALEEGGVSLTEQPQYKASMPWDQERPEKPWEVTE